MVKLSDLLSATQAAARLTGLPGDDRTLEEAP